MQGVFNQIGGGPAVGALVERFYVLVETQPQGAQIFRLHLCGHGMAHVLVNSPVAKQRQKANQ